MENNKTLWIVVAVGVFLLIISGTAWLLYGPERAPPQLSNTLATRGAPIQNAPITQDLQTQSMDISTETVAQSASTADGTTVQDRTNGVNSSVVIDGAPPRGDINLTIVTGQNNANWGTLDVSGLTRSNGTSAESAVSAPTPEQPGSETTGETTQTTVRPQPTTRVQTTATTRQPATKPAQSQPTTRPATGTTSTAVARRTAPTTVTTYWIQTGSFTNKLNAERSRDELTDRFLSAEIFTRDISGTTSYRVRVGPYSNKTEAEYWLRRIREISAFSRSYVSEVKIRK